MNLDGKVNAAALQAIKGDTLRDSVDEAKLAVIIDWDKSVRFVLGATPEGFHKHARVGSFEVWVRDGEESCMLE